MSVGTKKLRRLRMGLQTLFGLRTQGFFSPYRYADQVFRPQAYPEIERLFRQAELQFEQTLALMAEHSDTLAALNGPPPAPRWSQSWFPRLDGAASYVLVRYTRPNRIIEVGSGHSTRFLAQAVRDAELNTHITCIDPEPRADLKTLDIDWRARVLDSDDVASFSALEPGDVAFFDSSHLLWPGSDVDIILNRILPALQRGVLIHIHDVLLPDPYPRDWDWRGYTEQSALAGWLCGGAELVFSSHYAATRMSAAMHPAIAALPLPSGAFETSLWLRRV